MALTWIPRGILYRIQTLCSQFLWKGKHPSRIFAWVKWEALSIPKKWGGWGIKKLEDFSSPLTAKLGWQLITSNSLWTKVATPKYIAPLNVMDWPRQPSRVNTGISVIWKAVLKSLEIRRSGLTWRIQDGNAVRIGEDPWIGCGNAHRLPPELKAYLNEVGITRISHIADLEHTSLFQQAWKSAWSLLIPQQWEQIWENYTATLTKAHVRIIEGEDEIIWAHEKSGKYSPKEGYLILAKAYKPQDIEF